MSSSSEPSDDEADDPELALAIKLSLEMAAMDVDSRAREATAAGHVSPASEWASATLGAVPAASAPRPKGHLEDEEEGGGGRIVEVAKGQRIMNGDDEEEEEGDEDSDDDDEEDGESGDEDDDEDSDDGEQEPPTKRHRKSEI